MVHDFLEFLEPSQLIERGEGQDSGLERFFGRDQQLEQSKALTNRSPMCGNVRGPNLID
jgi:hypothetical protein